MLRELTVKSAVKYTTKSYKIAQQNVLTYEKYVYPIVDTTKNVIN